MSTHPMDREFRDRLYDGSATVPSGMWESIQGQIQPPRKSSRVAVWMWTGLALIVLASIALGLTLIRQGTPDTHAQTQNFESAISSSILSPEEQDEEVIPAKETSETDQSATTDGTRLNRTSPEESNLFPADHKPTISKAGIAPKGQVPGASESAVLAETPESLEPLSAGVKSNLEEEMPAEEPLSAHRSMFTLATIADRTSGLKYLPHTDPNTDCYSFGGGSSGNWLLEVYVGPTWSIRSLKSRPNENVDDYIAARDSTESAQISLHAGLRAGYEFGNGLTAKAGLHYTMVNEVFRLESRTVRTVYDSLFDNQGNFVRVDTTTEIGTRTEQQQNRFHSIDIPLLIGYRIDNGNWDFGIEAGPVFNIVYNAKGKMIGANGESFSFSDKNDPTYTQVFKDQVGISLYTGVYASKRIGNALWAFAEPHFQYRFKSVSLDDYPIDQRQFNLGLSLGLRLKF